MDAIVEIDSRMRVVSEQQDVISLKIARNALTPLGRLPSELLAHLTLANVLTAMRPAPVENGEAPRDLLHMTWLSSRIRAVLVNTPVLWATISFHNRWSKPMRDVFLARAASHPLDTCFGNMFGHMYDFEHAAAHISRTGSLHVTVKDERSKAFLSLLERADTPLLKVMDLANFNPWDRVNFEAPMNPHLTHLHLDMVQITGIPYFPALRLLSMSSTECLFSQLQCILSCTPGLTCLKLHLAMYPEDADQSPHSACVPRLAVLEIYDDLASVARLVTMLPVPSRTLQLSVRQIDAEAPQWATSTNAVGLIMSHVGQFWTRTMKGEHPFPPGAVTSTHLSSGFRENIEYKAGERDRGPFLRYTSLCKIASRDDILASVNVLNIMSHNRGRQHINDDSRMVADGLSLACLPNVEDLVIELFEEDLCSGHGQRRLETIESWVLARHQEGSPLRSIVFDSCPDGLMGLHERFRDQGVAQSVLWVVNP